MEEISDNEVEHEIEELEKPKPKRVLSDAQREILKKGRETARQKREAKKAEEMPKPELVRSEPAEVVEEVKPKRKYTKKVKAEPVPEPVPEPVQVVKTRKPRALKVEVKSEPVVETKPKVEELLERLIEVSSKKTKKINSPVQDEAKPKIVKQKKTKEPVETIVEQPKKVQVPPRRTLSFV